MPNETPDTGIEDAGVSKEQLQAVDTVRLKLNVSVVTDDVLLQLLYGDPPFDPPEELKNDKSLQEQFETLAKLHTNLQGILQQVAKGQSQERFEFVRDLVHDYSFSLEAYEEKCRQPFYAQLRKPLKMEGVSEKQMRSVIDDIRKPLEKEVYPPDIFSEKERKVLQEGYEALQREREFLLSDIDSALDNIRFGYPPNEEQSRYLLITMTEYLKRRWAHKAEVARKEPDSPPWMAFLGVAANEAIEEGAENSLRFGERSVFAKFVPGLETADAFFERTMNSSAEKVGEMLRARGIKVSPKATELFDMIKKSPMGPKFWERMLTIESPVTVLIFAYYLHTSSNKVKASMQFASFMAMSSASAAMMETLQIGLVRANYALLQVKQIQQMRRMRRCMRWMRRLPGNPAVHFFVSIAVMMGCHKWIDENVISPLEEAIPDGDWKHGAGGAMSILSGETILDSAGLGLRATGLPQRIGLMRLDPDRDETKYFSEEYLIDKTINPLNGLDTRFYNTIESWNEHVRAEIERETNPVKKKMWQEAIIRDRAAWAKRKAAEDVFPFVHHSKTLEVDMEDALRKAKGSPLKEGEHLDLLATATADTDEWDKIFGVTREKKDAGNDYTEGRNDRAIDYLVDRSDTVVGRVYAFIKTLPKDSELRKQWNVYMTECRTLAKTVAIYRHLGVYNKQAWTGDQEHMPEYVVDGLVECVVHELNRDKAIQWSGNGSAPDHAFHLADAIKVEKTPDYSPSGLIANAEQNFAQTKKEISQMGILDHLRWSTMGTYAFGDPRYNLRNVLSNVGQAAGEYLPRDAQNDVQESLRKLALNSEITDEAKMRESMAAIVGVMLKHNEKYVHPASQKFSEYLKIPEGVHVLSMDDSFTSSQSDFTKLTYGLSPYLSGSDILIFRRIAPGRGATTVAKTHIDCGSWNPEEWTVTTTFASTSPTARGETTIGGSVEKDVPLHLWLREHPDMLNVRVGNSGTMEELLQKQKERAAKTREYLRQHQEKMKQDYVEELNDQDEAREKAKAKPDVWIPYPSQNTRLDEKDTRPSYEYVAYLSSENVFIYMQTPQIYRGQTFVSNADSHVVAKRGKSSYTRISYEEEYPGKKNGWEQNRYVVDGVTDEKQLKDRTQLNAIAEAIGVVSGDREEAIAEAKIIHAYEKKGAHILVYTHGAQKVEVDGHGIYTVSAPNGYTAEFTMDNGRWVWRTKGTIAWDSRNYKEDPKDVKNPKTLEDYKYLNAIARKVGVVKGSEIPLTLRDITMQMSEEEIGKALLLHKYGATQMTANGETFYRLRGDNGRHTVEFTFTEGKWMWRNWGGYRWQRVNMDGDTVNFFNENRSSILGNQYLYERGLVLPIEGNDRASVQKILAPYVGSMESSRIIEVEDHIVRWYSGLNEADKVKFLSRLEREIYHATRATKTDAKGFLYLNRVTYETTDFGPKLTRYMYTEKVLPVMRKYLESLGYTFS